jgi:hypothetical protein
MTAATPIEWLAEARGDGYGRWGGWLIDICPMMFGDRLVLTPETCEHIYDYGWCYPKGGAALLAALAWDPEVEAEPGGYIKAIHMDGPRRAGQRAASLAVTR